jgi:hypothetical protein
MKTNDNAKKPNDLYLAYPFFIYLPPQYFSISLLQYMTIRLFPESPCFDLKRVGRSMPKNERVGNFLIPKFLIFMKKLLLIPISTFLCFLVAFTPKTQAQSFAKVVYDATNKNFTRVKTYQKETYASGTRDGKATLTKFDINGNWLWTTQMDFPSTANDFEIITDEPNEPAAAFYLIGKTEPSSSADNNRSFIAQINANGSFNWAKTYEQSGRESFNRIVRRYNPPGLPRYYVSAIKNQNGTQGTLDDGMIFVFDGIGTLLNRWQYNDESAIDSELGSNIINWNTNELLAIGNRVDANAVRYGIIYKINENSGGILNNFKLPDGYLILDAYRLSITSATFDLIISGIQHETNRSFIARLDGLSFATKWWHQIDNQNSLYDIGSDGNNRIYATGLTTSGSFNIITLQDNTTSATLLSARRIDDGASSSFQQGHLWVRPNENNTLVYTDSRIFNNGFNVSDIVIAKQGIGFEGFSCLKANNPTNSALNLSVVNQPITQTVLPTITENAEKGVVLKLPVKDFCKTTAVCNCDSLQLITTGNENCFKKYCVKKGCLPAVNTIAYSNVTGGAITSFTLDPNSGCQGQTAGNTIVFNPNCNNTCIPITISGTSNTASNFVAYTLTFTFEDGTICQKRDSFQCIVRCPAFSVNSTSNCATSVHVQPLSNVNITNVAYVLSGAGITSGSMTVSGGCSGNSATGLSGNINLNSPCNSPFDIALTSTGAGLTTYSLVVTLANGQTCQFNGQFKCDHPCFNVNQITANCSTVNPQGTQVYNLNLTISNPGPATSILVAPIAPDVIVGSSSLNLLANTINQTFTLQLVHNSANNPVDLYFYTLPGSPIICSDTFEVQLPQCDCMQFGKLELNCIGKNSNGQMTYHLNGIVTNLTGANATLNITTPQGNITAITPASVPNNSSANFHAYFTLTNSSATTACFTAMLGKDSCKKTICIKIPECDTCENSCKYKWNIKNPTVVVDNNSQFTLSSLLTGIPDLKQMRVTVISSVIMQSCISGGTSTLYPNTIFTNTNLPPVTTGYNTNELNWTDLSCLKTNGNLPLNLVFKTSIAAKKGCTQKIKICLRVTITDCNCVNCEKEICLEFIRSFKPLVVVYEDTNHQPRIAQNPSVKHILLSPNPASNYTNVQLTIKDTKLPTSLDILDIQGRIVEKIYDNHYFNDNKVELTIDTYDYSQGIYFLRYSNSDEILTEKLVITRD